MDRTPEYYKERRKKKKERKRERWKNCRKRTLEKRRQHTDKQRKRIGGWRTMLKKYCPCQECGLHYPPKRMSFDHVRGKKSFNISQGCHSYIRFWREIEKCDIVCRWCHDAREYRRGVFKKLRNPMSLDKLRMIQEKLDGQAT